MDILARIEEVIKQRGTNKAEVSEKMGKAKQNFKSLLTNPKWDSLELVCKAIGIEPWQLFEQEIMAAGYRIVEESKPQPDQPQEKDVEEFSYQDGQPSQDELPFSAQPSATVPAQLTADVAFICPHCHEAIKLGFVK